VRRHYVRRSGDNLMARVFHDEMPFAMNPDDDVGRSLTRPRKIDPICHDSFLSQLNLN